MKIPRRFAAPVAAVISVMTLVACGAQVAPSTSTVPASSAPSASIDIVARDAYAGAMCPVFTSILELDPRLTALRLVGSESGDTAAQSVEITTLAEDLRGVLDQLEAAPEWTQGAGLRYRLITSLHGIRAHLLHIAEDPTADSTAEDLAAIPFIATEAMDRAMQDAVRSGLSCEEGS